MKKAYCRFTCNMIFGWLLRDDNTTTCHFTTTHKAYQQAKSDTLFFC